MIDKKELEILLSQAPRFPKPKRSLEQYPTDSRTASYLLWYAYMRGDIEGRIVADLGCGTGTLILGALALGAREGICIDIDYEALRVAKRWIVDTIGDDNLHILCQDVKALTLRSIETVVMNPPFGVYRRGSDLEFLEVALGIASRAVYSIHKFNEVSHRKIVELGVQKGFNVELINVVNMEIPQIYETHVKRVHRFKVGLYRFERRRVSYG